MYDFATPATALAAVHDLKAWRRDFFLHPQLWKSVAPLPPLKWRPVRFSPANHAVVPKSRGVYAFVVQHDNVSFPPHGYVMYIGIVGDTSAARTLHARYREYLKERELKVTAPRPKVYILLQEYMNDLVFYFAEVKDTTIDLSVIEDSLLDVLIPPCNETFSANIRPAVSALR